MHTASHTHSLLPSLLHSRTHTHILTHILTHGHTHMLTHSLTHSHSHTLTRLVHRAVALAHNSAGPKGDIVLPLDGKATGFLASTAEEYAEHIHTIVTMSAEERLQLQVSFSFLNTCMLRLLRKRWGGAGKAAIQTHTHSVCCFFFFFFFFFFFSFSFFFVVVVLWQMRARRSVKERFSESQFQELFVQCMSKIL